MMWIAWSPQVGSRCPDRRAWMALPESCPSAMAGAAVPCGRGSPSPPREPGHTSPFSAVLENCGQRATLSYWAVCVGRWAEIPVSCSDSSWLTPFLS